VTRLLGCFLGVTIAVWGTGHVETDTFATEITPTRDVPPSPNTIPADQLFELKIRPLLVARCHACHGEKKSHGNLRLTRREELLQGGDSGAVVVPGEPDASLLIEAIEQHGELKMPPNGKLADAEIAAVKRWISEGALWPEASDTEPHRRTGATHWSFRPLVLVPVPQISSSADDMNTPVDAFVIAKLEERGLSLTPVAGLVALLRRVSIDVTGLPPSPEVIDEFLRDPGADAYERFVDRLLATPTFGECWGRHWLDLSGYVDTLGYDVNIAQFIRTDNKWLFRDYVVRAFNADKPFNEFISEQLAGDEISDWRIAEKYTTATLEPLIATGYLRNAEDRTDEGISPVLKRYEVLYDTLQIFGSNFLGLSLQCARCHDHKFEPVTQEDYYRLMAVFTPAFNPDRWKSPQTRPLPDVPESEKVVIDEHNKTLEGQIAKLKERGDALKQPYSERVLETRLAALPEPIRADTKKALEIPKEQRDEIQLYLAKKFESLLKFTLEDAAPFLTSADQNEKTEIAEATATLNNGRRRYGLVQAIYDVGDPPATHVLNRGDHESPERQVEPGFVEALSNSQIAEWMPSKPVSGVTSGRRTALARWITDPQSSASALAVRLLVNRLWGQLTGRGIVATRDNFGVTGTPPTHPELLEWLSYEFVRGGWKIKPLLRTILLSRTYRQATYRHEPNDAKGSFMAHPGREIVDPEIEDPGNELLWKMRFRRLESESIRDAMLSASDTLNLEIGGPPILTAVRPDGMTVLSEKDLLSPASRWRRSLYLLNRRQCNLSFLSVFDQPSMNINCPARQASAVPLQSLTMMNGDVVWQQAEQLAHRVMRDAGPRIDDQMTRAFRLTLIRLPDDDELERCRDFLGQQQRLLDTGEFPPEQLPFQALVKFCHTLLNTNEFIYLE